jgi:hypothetical protein
MRAWTASVLQREYQRQMEAHHASQLNEEVHQAIIYDGNGSQ